MEVSMLHPFTRWRFRRRLKGGVPMRTRREDVLKKLGAPQRMYSDEGKDIWVYQVGRTRRIDVSYSIFFEGEEVRVCWWPEEVTASRVRREEVDC